MKPFNYQIRNDTKRLLQGETCDNCSYNYLMKDVLGCKKAPIKPTVNTCWEWDKSRRVVYVDTNIHSKVSNGKTWDTAYSSVNEVKKISVDELIEVHIR